MRGLGLIRFPKARRGEARRDRDSLSSLPTTTVSLQCGWTETDVAACVLLLWLDG